MDTSITELINNQKTYFNAGKTRDINNRKAALKKLKAVIEKREKNICDALFADFKKCEFESLLTETQYIITELDNTIKKINSWARTRSVSASLVNFPSSAKIIKEPYGTVLIIAPWNYPFQLALSPLIGAIAAGNTAVVKPSELTPNTATIIDEIISEVFPKNHVAVVQGGKEVSEQLLEQQWNYIFFTGSPKVGKIVYQAAAKHITPVTLELGGKNPCIVDETADINQAAKRVVWGKFLNGGQTCIAPDYLLVAENIKQKLIVALKDEIVNAYTNTPKDSPDFPRIVNKDHFNRLKNLLNGQSVLFGGETVESELFIAPTLIDEPSLKSEVMKDEIFGPILPILSYKNENEIEPIISRFEKPLSLYVFSKRKHFANRIMNENSYGGGTINDTVVHFINKKLPFGGVGNSGIGAYHGQLTFDVFSHKKAVVRRGTWLDVPLKYAPYAGKLKYVKMLSKLF
ncbi:aldehyde dehydrogenase [Galbibacter mesophilus]|uniref:aldehyde dehydrogenase n=1 Tax=Galbibacter mesophilus TaxID=379069 RepID=UPI00191E41C9|nr:aldehyde dehydrogenase [Galbibacter mesophilus]MCM5663235.1 aldehyde dehydrogenase [Galbibacter mesophilus]